MSTRKNMAKARRQRSLIAKTFTALDNGQIAASDVLRAPPACLGRVRVYNVLRRIPHLNQDGAENVLRRAKVWPLKTMNNLTDEERARILRELPPRVKS